MKTNTFFRILLLAVAVFASTFVFAKKHIIETDDFFFTPANLEDVEVGDSVVWQWIGGAHTTTSTDIPVGAALWDQELSESNTTYTYVPTIGGTYRYICTPHLSLGMIGLFTVKFPSAVGDKKGTAPSINLFPNPFSDIITFNYESKGANLSKIEVYDLTGKKVYEENEGIQTGSDMNIYLGILAPGMYFLKFTDTGNHSWARRINKQ